VREKALRQHHPHSHLKDKDAAVLLSFPPQAYYDLPAVPSKGGSCNSNIRNRFDFQKSGRSRYAQNATG
jgi:hypothetical protein